MTPYEMGKQAALQDLGFTKAAIDMPIAAKLLGKAFGKAAPAMATKAAPAAAAAAKATGRAAAKTTGRAAAKATGKTTAQRAARTARPKAPSPEQLIGPEARPTAGASSESLRQQMMANSQAAAAAPEAGAAGEAGKGLLSKIPWWGKALGAGAVGVGGYQLLKKPKEEPQGAQPYYGPGTPQMPGY
jgi:hypothetical protein